jgi:UDP-glucose:(glucosyl)LPS alpha-1,2-glucosyltransferase
MSCIYKGEVIETEQSRYANGGTEQMRSRFIKHVDKRLQQVAAIHLSRVRTFYTDVPNILWAHDLCEDSEYKILENGGWNKFQYIVFVSTWQRDQFITRFNIPYSKCIVIENAVEIDYSNNFPEKSSNDVRFIYHTTPHRGLNIAYAVFDKLSSLYPNLRFDVFSSFEAYGWKERDKQFQPLFDELKKHPCAHYHGYQPNDVILEYLKKAHIFLYPSIWKETSCISLIEAIKSGCISIHPRYGALTETSRGNSIQYDFTESIEEHYKRCLFATNDIVKLLINKSENSLAIHNMLIQNHFHHNMKTFISSWESLLKRVENESK